MAEKKKKLIEGKKYHFLVVKTVVMPGNDQEYFVLEDPFHQKHLLRVTDYKNYELYPGKKIRCRIDKINCNGKIFIEPDHPQYQEGTKYEFEFVRFEKRINQIGEVEDVVIVKDVFGNEIIAPVPKMGNESQKKLTITCKVEVIKKGRIHLSVTRRGRYSDHLEVNRTYMFNVLQLARGLDNLDYYVLEDPGGQRHLIREKYYKEFQIPVGGKIRGTVVKYGSDGRFIIEPDHPYYKIGETYPFEALTKVREKNAQNGYSLFLIVKDQREQTYKVLLSQSEKLPDLPGMVNCTIDKMRKGKLVISLK